VHQLPKLLPRPSTLLPIFIRAMPMPIFIRIIRAMILTLIFGPCILNTLVSFVKSQLEKVNMLVEHQQLLKECIYSVLSPVIPSYTSL